MEPDAAKGPDLPDPAAPAAGAEPSLAGQPNPPSPGELPATEPPLVSTPVSDVADAVSADPSIDATVPAPVEPVVAPIVIEAPAVPPADMTPAAPPHPFWRFAPWIIVALVILFQGAVRYRLADFPLERDEGEYTYAGQLILQSIPPYELAYNMKLPGTYLCYAAIMAVFGESVRGIHMGLIVVNAACIVLMFLVGRKLFDTTAGVAAAAGFAVLSLSYKFLALSAHATHFVVLFVLGAVLCLLHASETGRRRYYLCSGILFGLAFLMKQQAVFFGIFGGLWIVWEELRGRPINWERMGERAGLFSSGCIMPFLWVCVVLWQMGVFEVFWFWTFDYAREYVTGASLQAGLTIFSQQMEWGAHSFWILMLLMLLGFVALWRHRPTPGRDTFLTVFFGCSFLTVCPGYYFRHHYFISVMPAAALLAGVFVSFLRGHLVRAGRPAWSRQLPAVLLLVALVQPLWRERAVLFQLDPIGACLRVYPGNPFIETQEVARYIKAHTAPSDRIAVFGSEPQIYFYSKRHSATGFIYTYSLVEEQPFALKMQAQMAKEVEASEPEFFVYVNVPFSWLTRPRAPREIFDWMRAFCRKNYTVVGVVDILSDDYVEYHWDAGATDYVPHSERHIVIFRRKPAP